MMIVAIISDMNFSSKNSEIMSGEYITYSYQNIFCIFLKTLPYITNPAEYLQN